METVFLLKSGMHSDIRVEGTFSTREKAEAALIELKKIEGEKAGPIVEVKVDEICDSKAKPFWMSTISVLSGELKACRFHPEFDRGQRFHWSHNCDWLNADSIFSGNNVASYPYAHSGFIPQDLHVYSSQSQEHADTLAAEARQYLMRKIDFSLIEQKHGGLFYPIHLSEKLHNKEE